MTLPSFFGSTAGQGFRQSDSFLKFKESKFELDGFFRFLKFEKNMRLPVI